MRFRGTSLRLESRLDGVTIFALDQTLVPARTSHLSLPPQIYNHRGKIIDTSALIYCRAMFLYFSNFPRHKPAPDEREMIELGSKHFANVRECSLLKKRIQDVCIFLAQTEQIQIAQVVEESISQNQPFDGKFRRSHRSQQLSILV